MQNELAAAQEELASSYLEVEHLQDELRSTNATGACCFDYNLWLCIGLEWFDSSYRTCRTSCAPPTPPVRAAWFAAGLPRSAVWGTTLICCSAVSTAVAMPQPTQQCLVPFPPLSSLCAVKSLFADVHSIKNKVFQERQERAAAAAAPSVPAVLQSLDQATC